MDLRKKIFNNFWPKLISLILATAAWFYVSDLVKNDSFLQREETVEEVFGRYKFIVKNVPVEPAFSGKVPPGFRIVFDEVKVEPSEISIFGPKTVLDDIDDLRTEKIKLGEYTRSVKLSLSLHSDAKFLRTKEKTVTVYIPIVPVVPAEEEK